MVCRLVNKTKKKEGRAKGQSGVFWGMRNFGVGGPIGTKFGSIVGLSWTSLRVQKVMMITLFVFVL